ncbi:uncharacterized protein LOC125005535 [Mugil cephalus]|uniref:uncharacterized protein LOC125005535 n=1 Tax=Mugil cephalus TaxID=48193 RepID=UPI001FB73C6F|nr:uncharacterized protein LOC125005535 [Mugil cephalus]
MDQTEVRQEGVPPSKTTPCGEHENQTGAQRIKQQRPDSPEHSCVSLKSDFSQHRNVDFKVEQPADKRIKQQRPDSPEHSCVSLKSDFSQHRNVDFKEEQPADKRIQQQRPDSPEHSYVSLKSDFSQHRNVDFKEEQPADRRVLQQSSEVPGGRSAQKHQHDLDSIFKLLEENMISFVKNELKKIQKSLSQDYLEFIESQRDDGMLEGEDEEQRRSSRDLLVKMTANFLRRMKQEELVDRLQRSKRI